MTFRKIVPQPQAAVLFLQLRVAETTLVSVVDRRRLFRDQSGQQQLFDAELGHDRRLDDLESAS